ncbi:uncharacterized protein ZBIST_4120 [Zygosaccharomyces bailii]|nr:uncharacterized protein ZBAI_08137 [Zygosaccharomyces bailii ISA1307]SJM87931.1 uncharacterized protein ZBIST_4120 [Zygosaccharomyces bailii]
MVFSFSSEQSHEKWKCSKLEKNTLTEDGLEVPLFHFQRRPRLLGSRSKCNPKDREANLIFLEQPQPISPGITAVPALTEVLECHGMLIHFTQNKIGLDAQRRREINNNPSEQLILSLLVYSCGKGGDC